MVHDDDIIGFTMIMLLWKIPYEKNNVQVHNLLVMISSHIEIA